jgi:hypothetical protein
MLDPTTPDLATVENQGPTINLGPDQFRFDPVEAANQSAGIAPQQLHNPDFANHPERDTLRAVLSDRANLGGRLPQVVNDSKTDDNPQDFRDMAANIRALAAFTGKDATEITPNYEREKQDFVKAQGWDMPSSEGAFNGQMRDYFNAQDAREQALDELRSSAILDAGKPPSAVDALRSYQEWNTKHASALSGIPETQTFQAWKQGYWNNLQQLQGEHHDLAQTIVDLYGNLPKGEQESQILKDQGSLAIEGLKAPIGLAGDQPALKSAQAKEARKSQLLDALAALPKEERQKVYQRAAALEKAKNPESYGLTTSLYSMGQALGRSVDWLSPDALDLSTSRGRVALELQHAARDTVNPLPYSDVNPLEAAKKGLPVFGTKVGQGLVGAAPTIGAFELTGKYGGLAYMLAQTTFENRDRLLVANETMTPKEALSFGYLMAVPEVALMSISFMGLKGAFPSLEKALADWGAGKMFAANTAVGGAAFSASGMAGTLADSAINALNAEWNQDASIIKGLKDTLLNAPQDFAMAAAFSLLHVGHKPDAKAGKRQTEEAMANAQKPGAAKVVTTADGSKVIMATNEKGEPKEVFRTKDPETAVHALEIVQDERRQKEAGQGNDWTHSTEDSPVDIGDNPESGPSWVYADSESQAWWEERDRLQAEYDATEPHTPERKAARKILHDYEDRRLSGGPDSNISQRHDTNNLTAAFFLDEEGNGMQTGSMEGAIWSGNETSNNRGERVRQFTLPDGTTGFLRLDYTPDHILEHIEGNVEPRTEQEKGDLTKSQADGKSPDAERMESEQLSWEEQMHRDEAEAKLQLLEGTEGENPVAENVADDKKKSPNANAETGNFIDGLNFEPAKDSEFEESDRGAIKTARSYLQRTYGVRPSEVNGLRSRLLPDEGGRSSNAVLASLQGALQSAFGRRIVLYDAPEGGPKALFPHSHPDVILINGRAKDPLIYLTGHEFTHGLERDNDGLYKELMDFVLSRAGDRTEYNKMLSEKGYKPERYDHEFLSDFVGSQFNEPSFWKDAAAKGKKFFRELANAALKYIDGVLGKTGEIARDVRGNFGDIQEVRNKLSDILNRYARGEETEETKLPETKPLNWDEVHEVAGDSNYRDKIQAELDRRSASSPDARTKIYENAAKRLDAITKRQNAVMEAFARGDISSSDVIKKDMERNLVEVNAILSAFPPNIRASLSRNWRNPTTGEPGNIYAKYASLGSEKAKADYLIRTIARADKLIDRSLAGEYREKIEETLRKAKPTKSDGGIKKSKYDASTQEYADMAYRASLLNEQETINRLEALEKGINDAQTPEEEAALVDEWAITNQYGSLAKQDHRKLGQTLNELDEAIAGGREARHIAEQARIDDLKAKQGNILENSSGWTDAGLDKAEKGKDALLSLGDQLIWSHASYESVLRRILPPGLENVVQDWSNRIRQANNATEKAGLDSWEGLIKAVQKGIGGKGFFKTSEAMSELQKEVSGKVSKLMGRKTKEVYITIDKAESILRGESHPGDLTKAKQESIEDELASLPLNSKKKGVTITRTVEEGKNADIPMTLNQMIFATMAWEQKDVREKMESSGWTQQSYDQMKGEIANSKVASSVLDFLKSFYKGTADMINPVHTRMYGMRLPDNPNYAPTSYWTKQNGNDISLGGMNASSASTTPGFLKARVKHGETFKLEDATGIYQSRAMQIAQWVSFAELHREISAVLNDKNVRLTLTQSNGVRLQELTARMIDTIGKGGGVNTDPAYVKKWLGASVGGTAVSAMGFNLKTIVNQFDASTRFLYAMPFKDVIKSLADPAGVMASMPAAWNSEAVQNRIKQGSNPAMRFVLKQSGMTTSKFVASIHEIAAVSMKPMMYADGYLTTLSSAIVYRDAHAKALESGLSPKEAEARALDAMDAAIWRFSQPVMFSAKSDVENTSNAATKLLYLFASDSRLRTGIIIDAVHGIKSGKGSKAEHLKKIGVVLAAAIMAQTISNAYRDIFSDDSDDEIWTWKGYGKAAALAPFAGYFLIGTVIDVALSHMTGQKVYNSSSNPMVNVEQNLYNAAKHAPDVFQTDDSEKLLKELGRISKAAAFTPAMAVPGAVYNPIKTAIGAKKNFDKER